MTAAVASRSPLERPRAVALAGVCVAVARHLGSPVWVVRSAFVATAFLGGGGILLYLWLWSFVPAEGRGAADDVDGFTRAVPVAPVLLGLAVIAAGVAVILNATVLATPLLPGMIESAVLAAGAVTWSLFVDRTDPARGVRSGPVVRISAAIVLVLEGALLLIAQGRPVVAVVAVFLVILGGIIVVIPRLVALWSELLGERSVRAREEQRAEIAAHLHDSVLQTLALIQNRAGPQSDVARLARAQERELRDWLFAGTDPFAGDLPTELRTSAAGLELEHPVRIEIVTAGDATAVRSAALAAAAREAMLNAALHAGGDVTVFVEATTEHVEVFVRDRGPGFDPDGVPDGRLGIRESIVGRMSRAGGSAIVTTDEDGTEVQLRLPRSAEA